MATQSPLNSLHQQAEASFLPYGGGSGGVSAQVVETFGEIEGEYAAIRKGCVLLDLPQRGTIRVTGKDRMGFLDRMVTQELKGLAPFHTRQTFWLNRKGRIDADLRLIELTNEMLVDVDVLSAAGVVKALAEFVFSEEVSFRDESQSMHRLALHGPTALPLLRAVSEHVEGAPLEDFGAWLAAIVKIAGRRVVVDRSDTTGEVGLELLMNVADVSAIYEQFLERGLNGHDHHAPSQAPLTNAGYRMRPAGWHAYNIARIEAGTPLFNIDFGPSSLPAETGILGERVSYTKGCYLGQEVVARMHSLGHPKQTLVGLRINPTTEQLASGHECQPVSGAALSKPDAEGEAIGAITSSTRSPMLGDAIIGFAAVKWGSHEAGTELLVRSDAGAVPAVVQAGLRFWGRN
jgi:folate-binding protein YgfZ